MLENMPQKEQNWSESQISQSQEQMRNMRESHNLGAPSQSARDRERERKRAECTLFVGNIHRNVTEVDIYSKFVPFGDLVMTKLIKNWYTKESRGFAFITFREKAGAERAQQEMNLKRWMNQELIVQFADKIDKREEKFNFVVKNIPEKMTGSQLKELCQDYGPIITCFVKYIIDRNNQVVSSGQGYVQFEKVDLDEFVKGIARIKNQ